MLVTRAHRRAARPQAEERPNAAAARAPAAKSRRSWVSRSSSRMAPSLQITSRVVLGQALQIATVASTSCGVRFRGCVGVLTVAAGDRPRPSQGAVCRNLRSFVAERRLGAVGGSTTHSSSASWATAFRTMTFSASQARSLADLPSATWNRTICRPAVCPSGTWPTAGGVISSNDNPYGYTLLPSPLPAPE